MPYGFYDVPISESYGRVVQYVSSSFYDGLGNLIIPVSASYALSASYAPTGNYTIISSSYTITPFDAVVEVVVPFVTQSLPTAVGNLGYRCSIVNATTGSIMILASGSETIGNSAVINDTYLIVLPQDAPLVISNNAIWRII